MEKDIRIKFAKRLRKLRDQKGWTQEQLAEYADLAYRHVQRLESIGNPPPAKIDTIGKLAKAFKLSPSELIDFWLVKIFFTGLNKGRSQWPKSENNGRGTPQEFKLFTVIWYCQ